MFETLERFKSTYGFHNSVYDMEDRDNYVINQNVKSFMHQQQGNKYSIMTIRKVYFEKKVEDLIFGGIAIIILLGIAEMIGRFIFDSSLTLLFYGHIVNVFSEGFKDSNLEFFHKMKNILSIFVWITIGTIGIIGYYIFNIVEAYKYK